MTDQRRLAGPDARAFGQGADARLAGHLPRCPYRDHTPEAYAWQRGWEHCNREWAVDARWPHRVLPTAE